jgi:hypothetical protein
LGPGEEEDVFFGLKVTGGLLNESPVVFEDFISAERDEVGVPLDVALDDGQAEVCNFLDEAEVL